MEARQSKRQLLKDWRALRTVLKSDVDHWEDIVSSNKIRLTLLPENSKDWNTIQNTLGLASVYKISAEHYLELMNDIENGSFKSIAEKYAAMEETIGTGGKAS